MYSRIAVKKVTLVKLPNYQASKFQLLNELPVRTLSKKACI